MSLSTAKLGGQAIGCEMETPTKPPTSERAAPAGYPPHRHRRGHRLHIPCRAHRCAALRIERPRYITGYPTRRRRGRHRWSRPEQLAQQAAQHAPGHDCNHQQQRQPVARLRTTGCPIFFTLGQRFAVYHRLDLVNSRFDSTVVIAEFEARRDGIGNDVTGHDVRQRTLQAPGRLDAHAMVVLCYQQNGPIVDALALQLSRVIDPNAILLDVLGFRTEYYQHDVLGAFPSLEGRELGLQSIDGPAGPGAGQIGETSRQRGHCDLGAHGQRGQC